MNLLLDRILFFLEKNQLITQSERYSCKYGLEVFILSLINLMSLILISLAVGNFRETIVFLSAFVPVRLYGGGYHSNTRINCFIVMIMSYSVFTVLIKSVPISMIRFYSIVGAVISLYIVIKNKPIVHENRKRINRAISDYHLITITIAMFESLIIIIGQCIKPNNIICFAFMLGFLLEAVVIVVARRKVNI